MSWNQNLTNLRDWFASRYTLDDSRRLVDQVGLNSTRIAFDSMAVVNWYKILTYADHQHMVDDLIDAAIDEYPNDATYLRAAKEGQLTGLSGLDIESSIDWKATEDPDTLEKIIGTRQALLPIHFLEVGVERAKSVVRVQLESGGSGSGFLARDNLLITNHHVIPSVDVAASALIQCNYQLTSNCLHAPMEQYGLSPESAFATSIEHDWTAVRVTGSPNDRWGYLSLEHVEPKQDDWINIIQHPGGGLKQIALYDNLIVFVNHDRIQYLTDTMPGSSGSPCFDSEWRVIALHHSGGWLTEPGTKRQYFRNQGIHINRILEGLSDAGFLS